MSAMYGQSKKNELWEERPGEKLTKRGFFVEISCIRVFLCFSLFRTPLCRVGGRATPEPLKSQGLPLEMRVFLVFLLKPRPACQMETPRTETTKSWSGLQ